MYNVNFENENIELKKLLLECEKILDENNATSLGSSYCSYCQCRTYDGNKGLIHENNCIMIKLRKVVGRNLQ